MEGRYGETAESQDICFIPGGDYRAFIGEIVPEKKGPIVTVEGREIGFHRGMHLYTIGQRRGVNIPYREALYVVAVRPEDNAVVVGPKEALLSDSLTADEVNVLGAPPEGEARAKVRYRQKEELCSYALRDGILEVTFRRPVSAVAPGQAVVLYDGERVLGGGTITGAWLRPGTASASRRPG
jgi:tRNA-specific 2-thiouridylase